MKKIEYILDKRLHSKGYLVLRKPARDGREIFEHVLIAEKALGKSLPDGAEVHHWDENKANNKNSNLVICPDLDYHRLLHQRMRAKEACGHANWLHCHLCNKYDDPKNLYVYKNRRKGYHKSCMSEYQKDRYNKDPESHKERSRKHRRKVRCI